MLELKFFSDALRGTNCVSMLVDELHGLEENAKEWDFPYSIIIGVRCGPNMGKTFRRFYKAENYLTIDIREKDSEYMVLSKNEQRERLGKLLFHYFEESINKYPQYADKPQRAYLISKVEQWLMEHNWLRGKIEQARLLLQDGTDLFEVSQLLNMSLEEIEDIFLALHETEKRTQIHKDNLLANKGWPYT